MAGFCAAANMPADSVGTTTGGHRSDQVVPTEAERQRAAQHSAATAC